MVRRMDINHRLILTDIAAEDFDSSSVGKRLDALMREIHGRHPDGRWVVGVEVFREIYSRVGFETLTSISKWPAIRSLLDVGYKCFAWPRYRLALRRMRKAGREVGAPTGASLCDRTSAESSCQQVSSSITSDSVSATATID